MGIIPMDQVGYNRLLIEIEKAKEDLQRIRQSHAEQLRNQHSEDSFMDANIFLTMERQATKKLDDLLAKKRSAKIVDAKHAADTIGYGSIVKIIFLEESNPGMVVRIVTNSPRDGEVSVQSPIGNALYGHKVGDVVGYTVGDCFFQAKVESID